MREIAHRQMPMRLRRLAATAMVAVLTLGGWWSQPPTILAARPAAQGAAEFLALRDGGGDDNWQLVYERQAMVPGSGELLWVGKLADARTGRLATVYRDAAGTFGGAELLRGRQQAVAERQSAFERKASAALREAVTATGPSAASRGRPAGAQPGTLPVTAWLSVDLDAAERSVIAGHPEVAWAGNRPLGGDLARLRQLRAEMWTSRRDAIAAAAAQLEAEVRRQGGSVAYVSSSAPVVVMDLPPRAAQALAAQGSVQALGLEATWQPAMSAAGPAVEANWTGGSGDQGAGIRVGVVEYHNVRKTGDLVGRVVKSHSTSGTIRYSPTFDHPTWVAGAIASQSATYRGVAPAALIVSSGTGGYSPSLAYDRAIIAATDWSVSPGGGDVDIVNTSLVQDTTTGSEEARRYFDSVVERDGRLSVSAAGNYVNFNSWQIGSPGTAHNVLTVGGVDDRGSAGLSDDRIWYVPGSNGSTWLDRPSDPWNAHGDFNKPNLVAPAVGVRTANGLAASGTSVATPIVAGVAAQVMANEPQLAGWPEGLRAVLMAGAIHHVPMPDGSSNADHEGVGMTSALWSNRVAVAGDGQLGGYRIGSLAPGDEPAQQVSVRAGDRLRVALAWNSHTTGSGNLNLTDALRADLDLRVTDPAGKVVGSYTFDNAYEFVEMVMPVAGTATLRVLQSRFDGSSETYGLAWAKVRDTTAPSVTLRVPQPGEPWAVPGTEIRATFSEKVTGVAKRSFKLQRVSSGAIEAASVSYQSSSRTAILRPSRPLKPGAYRVIVRPPIGDAAGNMLPRTTWRFSVRQPVAKVSRTFPSPRTIRFEAGTHVGYHFDASGNVTGSKAYALSHASTASADRRASISGKPGVWLRVRSGVWDGYWVRESAAADLAGKFTQRRFSSPKRADFAAGAHVGHRYDAAGRVTGSRSFTLGRASGAHVDRRAVINGAWQMLVTDGVWAGYWIPESPAAHVPGIFELTDLGGARAVMERGRRTAYRYDAGGEATASRTVTLGSRSGAPTAAWAVINGQPAYYVLAGGWAGYWLPESAGVHLP